MKAKHTPGPWKIQDDSEGNGFRKDWRVIVREEAYNKFGAHEQVVSPSSYESSVNGTYSGVQISEADARLIAAAPELLEALNYLLEQTVDMDLKYGIELSEGEEDARNQALAAIAKASGE